MFRILLTFLASSFLIVVADAEALAPIDVFSNAVEVETYIYEPSPGAWGVMSDFHKLNSTAVPSRGIVLTRDQQHELRDILHQGPWPPDHAEASCFDPHHGFIFRDAKGHVVGTLDVCFECANYSYRAPGYEERWSAVDNKYDAIRKKSGKAWDPERERQRTAEIERIRADLHMPPQNEALDWGGLQKFIRSLRLPIKPTAEDFSRVAKLGGKLR